MVTQTIKSALSLKVKSVHKRVSLPAGTLDVLNDISFEVPAGGSLAIVGRSGSGKTTLLGILAGLDVATQGQVYLGDTELCGLSEDKRADVRGSSVGFVFQSFHLLDHLNAVQNVMLPLELSGANNARAVAEDYLSRVGLAHRLTSFPKQLSGGEQQRVAIARAFACSPKVLFADEPTGNLDSATGKEIIDCLFALNQEQGTTLVLVTHDTSLADRCDQQLRLEAGRLVNG